MKMYLLSIRELQEGTVLLERCMEKVDAQRREKARSFRSPGSQFLSVGAGLLLQLSSTEENESAEDELREEHFSVSQLLDRLQSESFPRQLSYVYDAKGKPQFADNLGGTIGFPLFNLSHSGEYVCCAVGREEVGIDIQKMRPLKDFRVAERYFSEQENAVLKACADRQEREKLFYDMWVRKEAYAKLTGEGVATGVRIDTLQTKQVVWQKLQAPEGYCMAVCRYQNIHLPKEEFR